jgi:hypothetical protein
MILVRTTRNQGKAMNLSRNLTLTLREKHLSQGTQGRRLGLSQREKYQSQGKKLRDLHPNNHPIRKWFEPLHQEIRKSELDIGTKSGNNISEPRTAGLVFDREATGGNSDAAGVDAEAAAATANTASAGHLEISAG